MYNSCNCCRAKGSTAPVVTAKRFGGSAVSGTVLALITGQWNHGCFYRTPKICVVPTPLILKPPTVIKAVFQMSITSLLWSLPMGIYWDRRSWHRQEEKQPGLTQLLPPPCQPPAQHNRDRAPQDHPVVGIVHLKKQILQWGSEQMANKWTGILLPDFSKYILLRWSLLCLIEEWSVQLSSLHGEQRWGLPSPPLPMLENYQELNIIEASTSVKIERD